MIALLLDACPVRLSIWLILYLLELNILQPIGTVKRDFSPLAAPRPSSAVAHRRLADGAIIQQIDDFGTEIYARYLLHSLDRSREPGVEDLNVGAVAARATFQEGPSGQSADACMR